MDVIFCGVRGTNPVTEPRFAEYGGQTTSVLVTGRGGERVGIDAGTGVADAGRRMLASPGDRDLLMLMTHYHLDHVMGLGLLAPLHDPAWRVRFAAPKRGDRTVRSALTALLGPPYWPVSVGASGAAVEWTDLGDAPYVHGGLRIRWCAVRHPDGCAAYRIDEEPTGASLVFATDIEWSASSDEEKAAFLRLSAEPEPARLLVIDGQFTRETFEGHAGWGHSTVEEAAEIAGAADADALIVTHHAPDRDDAALARDEARLKERFGNGAFARQGMVRAL